MKKYTSVNFQSRVSVNRLPNNPALFTTSKLGVSPQSSWKPGFGQLYILFKKKTWSQWALNLSQWFGHVILVEVYRVVVYRIPVDPVQHRKTRRPPRKVREKWCHQNSTTRCDATPSFSPQAADRVGVWVPWGEWLVEWDWDYRHGWVGGDRQPDVCVESVGGVLRDSVHVGTATTDHPGLTWLS